MGKEESSVNSGGPAGEARTEEPGCAPASHQIPTAPQSEDLNVTKHLERNKLHDIDYAVIWHQTFKRPKEKKILTGLVKIKNFCASKDTKKNHKVKDNHRMESFFLQIILPSKRLGSDYRKSLTTQ